MGTSEFRRGLWALLLIGLASTTIGGGVRAQTYDDGMRGYNSGDFAKALEIWGPVAENGDGVAQFCLCKLL